MRTVERSFGPVPALLGLDARNPTAATPSATATVIAAVVLLHGDPFLLSPTMVPMIPTIGLAVVVIAPPFLVLPRSFLLSALLVVHNHAVVMTADATRRTPEAGADGLVVLWERSVVVRLTRRPVNTRMVVDNAGVVKRVDVVEIVAVTIRRFVNHRPTPAHQSELVG